MHYTELFDTKSDLYARARPTYPETLYTFLAEQCTTHQLAWDCACGNGQSAINLINHFDHVNATDVSANQIANAFTHPNITYSVCPSEQTPFKSQIFDAVCIAQALHWMDFDRFWPEVQRVLKPDGIFAAWGYTWTKLTPEIDAIVQTALLDVIKPYWAPQNKLLWDHYQDVSIPFELIDTPEFTMRTAWTLAEFVAYLHTWSSTRRCMDTINDNFFDALYQQLAGVWGDAEQRKTVSFEFCCLVGRNTIHTSSF
ncbi:MAG: class I SAM-dependent methyltransferase [Deinococcota bacterium]